MASDTRVSMSITIDNLTEAQRLAIVDMLAMWQVLESVGSSRDVTFYVDGDGNFHPDIRVDGVPPKACGSAEEVQARWRGDQYRIDYDEIAWKLHDKSWTP
jgi:hypothetical protein